jgi:para-aminobenzoate synthetase/4-amino-4-deoxychorismate lyase
LTGLSPYPADQEPLGLIETMRFERGVGILRLERHLARLCASAAYFSIAIDLGALRRSLAERAAKFTDAMRVRLLVPEIGPPSITAEPLVPVAQPWRCRISGHPIDSADPFRAHKTTRRGLYDEEYAHAKSGGFGEVLFLNERDELAEGSRTNVFLERGGKLLTPPISAGALPGILRAELLDSGWAIEARLMPADFSQGTLFVGNSLRGLLRARIG